MWSCSTWWMHTSLVLYVILLAVYHPWLWPQLLQASKCLTTLQLSITFSFLPPPECFNASIDRSYNMLTPDISTRRSMRGRRPTKPVIKEHGFLSALMPLGSAHWSMTVHGGSSPWRWKASFYSWCQMTEADRMNHRKWQSWWKLVLLLKMIENIQLNSIK